MNESEQAIIQADTAQILSKIGKSPYLMTLRKGGGVGPVYSCIHEHITTQTIHLYRRQKSQMNRFPLIHYSLSRKKKVK